MVRHFLDHLDRVLRSFGGLDTDVLYLDVMGMDMLVVDSVDAAIDLLEKKSSTYADRVWFGSGTV